MKHIKIYQIHNIEETVYAFREYDQEHFNMADYKLVAETDIEIPERWLDDVLEYIFMVSDVQIRPNFKMHSISVSDIIEIDGKRHYVQGFGFKEIPEEGKHETSN